ncbi:Pleckstrin homology domain-containing family D member 1 [Oopsacas minuta]|uniref:Pleckstrin homology domain-containing family D member 1 n=1 Tax=Oopsacas minuta TaxID=111878 RepID=A0AAV7KB79_9METZ|nr:Pleckstrin homology domain-containing family D member 1 [Oopsacas minuta]
MAESSDVEHYLPNKETNVVKSPATTDDITRNPDEIGNVKRDKRELLRQKSKSTADIEDDIIQRSKSDFANSSEIFVGDDESFSIDAKVQYSGYLYKQPFGHKSKLKRWQRRFFVIKEGFLLYYSEAEGRIFEKGNLFNIHPKGVIPLGGCTVSRLECPGHRNSIAIHHENFSGGAVVMATCGKESQDVWIDKLKASSRVTWKNSALGAKLVQEYTQHTQDLIGEKQKFIEKLDHEVEILAGEREKKDELEELSKRLSEEKAKLQEQSNQFKAEKGVSEAELEEAMKQMKSLDKEREKLREDSENLQSMLQVIETEKDESIKELEKNLAISETLRSEKEELVKKTETLNQDLTQLEARSRAISEGKFKVQRELSLHIKESSMLQNQAEEYRKQYEELESHIKDLSDEKLTAETKYIAEHKSRIMSDKRLRQAEAAVKRLDAALKERGITIDIDLDTDIKGLIGFFEEVIEEATFEKQKLDIMRSAVTARHTYEHDS